ncbi:inverse autotransporter beta domain-containing protein [Veillonella sp.]
MKRQLFMKSLLCAALTCSFATCALAADKNGWELNAESNQQSWMDRTEVGIKFQREQDRTFYSERFITQYPSYDKRYTRSKKYDVRKPDVFIETLQPVGHYDNQSKDVVFVQGKLASNAGDRVSSDVYFGGNHQNFDNEYFFEKLHNKNTDAIGVIGTVGVGYRRLSENEHSYVGVNTFFDYGFKDSYKRISVGAEYVSGLNAVHANIYRGLTNKKKGPYTGYLRASVPKSDPFYPEDRGWGPSDGTFTGEITHDNVVNGFDIGYTRSYKNARWAQSYVDVYHWNMNDQTGHRNYYKHIYYINEHKQRNISGFKIGNKFQLTPHLSLDIGYNKAQHTSGEPYLSVMYTLGHSKFAYYGGKHSDDTVTTARSKMLDKVARQDMVVESYHELDYLNPARDHL